MYCSNCGTQLETDATICPRCGTAIRANPNSQRPLQDRNTIISAKPQAEAPRIPSSIPLVDGERILWHKEITHGLLRKEVTVEEVVTGKRCLKYTTPTLLNNHPHLPPLVGPLVLYPVEETARLQSVISYQASSSNLLEGGFTLSLQKSLG